MSASPISLSSEHDSFEWLRYEEAFERLTWDSNRVALWELSERLKRDGSARLSLKSRSVDT